MLTGGRFTQINGSTADPYYASLNPVHRQPTTASWTWTSPGTTPYPGRAGDSHRSVQPAARPGRDAGPGRGGLHLGGRAPPAADLHDQPGQAPPRPSPDGVRPSGMAATPPHTPTTSAQMRSRSTSRPRPGRRTESTYLPGDQRRQALELERDIPVPAGGTVRRGRRVPGYPGRGHRPPGSTTPAVARCTPRQPAPAPSSPLGMRGGPTPTAADPRPARRDPGAGHGRLPPAGCCF